MELRRARTEGHCPSVPLPALHPLVEKIGKCNQVSGTTPGYRLNRKKTSETNMTDLHETGLKFEPDWAAVIGIQKNGETLAEAEESLAELERLIDSADAITVCSKVIRLRNMSASVYLSKGHMEDLYDWGHAQDCDCFIIDDEFSPVQQRNLETFFKCPVLTRTHVILNIFALHARTNEAMTQVELAQLRYNMPRLVGAGIASAKGGGSSARIASRGPGEKQLEVDRRAARARVQKLEKTLKNIEVQRETQRQRRMKKPLPLVGIIGYTNAGKSTLLNQLTNANILAEDKLFATLETTVRTLRLPSGLEVGLIDTVGFVNKLPPTLLAAFRATLEETVYADLILHVADSTSARLDIEFQATRDILEEIHCADTPRLTVWNKIDQMDDPVRIEHLTLEHPPAVAISALTGEGTDKLLAEIERIVMEAGQHVILSIPHDRYDLVTRLHNECQVLETRSTAEGTLIHCRTSPHMEGVIEPYKIDAWPEEEEKFKRESE